ncbi:hypothetical protein S7711_01135 [Stachybotrys chartarum IBT 7711]|uniref:Uncharacterized protein n=1 Tax=Stachybotrys chartarum (strain CBS 109288 / IBT 7711) TaxID=1280523 RepID=A0A084ASS8_STACB|nr:hypothetical protein S7711_01135 [Stachybotrys chartarum IBT 7711]
MAFALFQAIRLRCGMWGGRARWRVLFGIAALVAVFLFVHFVVPTLQKLDFHSGLTYYDIGLKGFMPSRSYHSFSMVSPDVEFLVYDEERCNQDYFVMAPRGPAITNAGGVIMDRKGELIWRQDQLIEQETQDLRVQEYRGEKFLTFWVGVEAEGFKKGVWYMMDQHYEVRHQIACASGLSCDMHEFQITPEGTALLAVYESIPADLSSIGGSSSGWLLDCRFQEIDIETGQLLFEWKASEHFDVANTFKSMNGCQAFPSVFDGCGTFSWGPFDYFHINSIQKDENGYLVSARNLHSIFYVNKETGAVAWTLGGKKNEFSGFNETIFSWQHHARWHGDAISLFDNAHGIWDGGEGRDSRAMIIQVDPEAKVVEVKAQYPHPDHLHSASQGNVQVLENGNVFVGWGRPAVFSEFAADGTLLLDAHFGASAYFALGLVTSYRVLREKWEGRPRTLPDAVVEGHKLYVSWNGATEIVSWKIEGSNGQDTGGASEWEQVSGVPKDGFETVVELPDFSHKLVRAVAIDHNGETLGETNALAWPSTLSIWLGTLLSILSKAFIIGVVICLLLLIRRWRRGTKRVHRSRGRWSYSLLSGRRISSDDEESEADLVELGEPTDQAAGR